MSEVERKTLLAARIYQCMEALNLTDAGLAELAGVGLKSLRNVLNGDFKKWHKVPDLAIALGVDADWLATGMGSMLPQTPSPENNAAVMDIAVTNALNKTMQQHGPEWSMESAMYLARETAAFYHQEMLGPDAK